MMDLSERKRKILQAVIDEYIGTAEPVGSRAISKNSALNLSSATIRNEMSDLEEMGLLIQPHTSAGRIPSDEGYRFYVSTLMSKYRMGMEAITELQKAFQMRIKRLDQIIEYAGLIASSLTDYATIVTAPKRDVSKLRKFDLIPMALEKTMLITVTDVVRSQLTDIRLTSAECEAIAAALNRNLTGITSDLLTRERAERAKAEIIGNGIPAETADMVLAAVCSAVADSDEDAEVYIANEKSILDYPEYRDVSKASKMLSLLENKDRIRKIVNSGDSDGIVVKIGSENEDEEMKDCSLITANYSVGGKKGGKIAVIGPKRMNYSKVFSSLDVISNEIEKILRYYTEE